MGGLLVQLLVRVCMHQCMPKSGGRTGSRVDLLPPIHALPTAAEGPEERCLVEVRHVANIIEVEVVGGVVRVRRAQLDLLLLFRDGMG